MNTNFLEIFYEIAILPNFDIAVDLKDIKWKSHGKVDLDAWAHYFDDKDGREYVLLYEDFPDGAFLKDGLTHEPVKVDDEISFELKFGNNKQVPNLTGWFTLYREK